MPPARRSGARRAGKSDFALVRPHLEEVVRLLREAAPALAPALGLDALRRADGRLPARHGRGRCRRRSSPTTRSSWPGAAAGGGDPGRNPPRCRRPARSPSPCRRRCAGACPSGSARLRPCPAGPFGASVLRRHAHRRPHHHLLRRGRLQQAVLGVLHETGHALYERGLPAAWARQPVGEAAGMAAHESQSLIVEMQACRSDAFLDWLGPRAACGLRRRSGALSAATISRGCWRRVERGFIRVDADELTYPAHVILRFRLERALIGGELAVADLPGAWNEGFRVAARHRPAGRCARLPAGHPLARRRVRLFPQLHAGRDGRGAIDGGGAARRRRASTRRLAAATCRRCSAGCAPRCTARAPCSTSRPCCRTPPASRSIPPTSRRI